MKPDPLIQKLFAIERAIGHTAPGALRLMVIEAEESALQLELELLNTLHRLENLKRIA